MGKNLIIFIRLVFDRHKKDLFAIIMFLWFILDPSPLISALKRDI